MMLSPENQGSWYAISGLQRFQALIELGMGVTLGAAVARSGRGGAWLRMGVLWHLGMALGWLLIAGPIGGFWLYNRVDPSAVGPWVVLTVVSAVGMPILPLLTTLEARQQVAAVSSFRTIQGIFSRVGSWVFLAMGGGLWAQGLERALSTLLSWGFFWVLTATSYFPILSETAQKLLKKAQHAPPLSYKMEVFPLQWRIAAATAGGTLPFAMLIPVATEHAGKVEGGQLGALLTVLGGLQGMAWALLTPVFPAIGHLLSEGRRTEATRQLSRSGALSLGVFGMGIAMIVGVILWGPSSITSRIPEGETVLWMSLGFEIRLLRELYASWCRADLRPITWPADLLEGGGVVLAWMFWGESLSDISEIFAVSSLINLWLSLYLGRR
jgi:hypothetical protein